MTRSRDRSYQDIFHSVNDAISVHDPDTGEIVDVNDTYVEAFGYDRETILDLDIGGLSVSEEGFTQERGTEIIREVAETGDPVQGFEWLVETADGERRWFEVNATLATIDGEDRVLGISRDVTEQKRNQRALRRSERRFREILERTDEIIYYAAADFSEVYYVNPAYEGVWGRSREALYEAPLEYREAIVPTDRDRYDAELDAMLADFDRGDPNDSYVFDYRIRRSDGEIRWIHGVAYPVVDDHHVPTRLVGVVKDVTERKRREETLETFHEATRTLTGAETRMAACRLAVDAAESVVDLPFVCVYLHDQSTGSLELTATTDPLADAVTDDALDGFSTIEPGSGNLWQAFVEGESIHGAAVTGDLGLLQGIDSSSAMVVPLGRHGIMLLAASNRRLTDEEIELIHILTVTVEAALNHAHGERKLEARERQLEAQTERIERLSRLNRLIRRIEQATIEHSTRETIERAVCNGLVDVEPYDTAWIVELDPNSRSLVPRTTADLAGGAIESQPIPLDAGVGPRHPAITAFEEGSVEVVDSLVDLLGDAPWRRQALSQGYQTCCAVPLVYEGHTDGILVVLAERPDAFSLRERETLGELGRSIGYAIDAARRKRALESDVTTEVEFAVDRTAIPFVELADRLDGTVDLERTIRRTDGSMSVYHAVETSATESEIVSVATSIPPVLDVRFVATRDDVSHIEIHTADWWGAPFTERGGMITSATATGDTARFVVEVPRSVDVRAMVTAFHDRYPHADLVARRENEGRAPAISELQAILDARLTDRQREVVETAYAAGYFEWPRESSGQDIAELLDITQPTFNKHLRIAERAAFALLLDD